MAEIKISELSIGDWVRMGGGNFQIYLLALAGDVYGYRRTNDSDTGEEYYDGEIGDVEPIPLTPEILEKNGFEKLKDKSWVGHNHHCDIQQHGSSWTLLSNKRGFYRTICFESLEFVHELQHALRLAGVEKEIEV